MRTKKHKESNHVLFVIKSLHGGGAERVLVTIANEFCAEGKQVTIVTYNDSVSAYVLNASIKRVLLFDGKEPDKQSLLYQIRWRLWKFRKIRSVVKQESPDVVISFVTMTNNDVIFSLLGTGIPVVACEHTNVLRSYGLKTTLYRKLIYPFATAITVLTRHDYRIWKNIYHQTVYMPNPISLGRGEVLPMLEREKIVLAVGTVSSWRIKGFDNLLRVWGSLCNRFPEWKLCIAGTSDETSLNYLKAIIADFNCKNVSFLGFRDDIHALMERASVFCLSSRVEGLPMVLIEAMSMGCCCVSFDCITGPNEIIKKDSGLLVQDQNLDDLTKKLALVMSNSELRSRLSKNAPLVLSGFSLNRVIYRWLILLGKITNN